MLYILYHTIFCADCKDFLLRTGDAACVIARTAKAVRGNLREPVKPVAVLHGCKTAAVRMGVG